jgi:hypothetical protein
MDSKLSLLAKCLVLSADSQPTAIAPLKLEVQLLKLLPSVQTYHDKRIRSLIYQ